MQRRNTVAAFKQNILYKAKIVFSVYRNQMKGKRFRKQTSMN
ncbi:hypothetical protein HMPREF9419_0006 [Prevotella nigrescens ATCC 33563]|nr:hypothetical protein HMPREF9419_0006 [Prevotella nigrescens ATCC 33563]